MSEQQKQQAKFYLTTPIYYVNARPHIGHAYTTIVADVIARRHRLLGDDTWFLTGTDEHGQKIERAAAAAGVPPQQYADQVSASFRNLWARMGITFEQPNGFIRTTDPKHIKGVQKLFTELYEQNFIYLDSYTGAYCVSDETFVDVQAGDACPDCGRITEIVTEENFFFKLSVFQEKLIDLIESNTLKIENDARRNEVLSFLVGRTFSVTYDTGNIKGNLIANAKTLEEANEIAYKAGLLGKTPRGYFYLPQSLKDLSVSRSSFTWGIPVPKDIQARAGATKDHVIYVWLDALANYITAVGYGSEDPADQAMFERYWPADLHLVGKEIIRFHCVYWPAFLLAAGLPLPKAITAHGWLLFEDSKMSKSRGNIVRTETILDAFGSLKPKPEDLPGAVLTDEAWKHEQDLFASDVLRYFLLREIPFGQDGSFSFDALITRYNADLANGYGNLVSRTLSMIQRYFGGLVPGEDRLEWDEDLWAQHAFKESAETFVWSASDQPALIEKASTLNLFSLVERASINRSLHEGKYGNVSFSALLAELTLYVGLADGYLSKQEPWKLAKADDQPTRAQLANVLYAAAESIRLITGYLYPFIPYATAAVWAQLGLGDIEESARKGELKGLEWGGLKPGTKLGPLSPVFPRAPKELIQTMIDKEQSLLNLTAAHDAKTSTHTEFAEAPLASAPQPSKFVDEQTTHPAPIAADPTHSIPFHSIPFHSIPFHSIPFHSIPFHSIPLPPSLPPSPHPAAPPRTSALSEQSPGTQVAASAALTTERPGTPSHTEAQPSGVFAQSSAPSVPETPAQIAIDDFVKIDLRVAQIVVAERIPKADKLLRLEVDLGYEKRQILSGIAEWYTPEELLGRRIVIIANLAPRKMRGLESHGMLLAASGEPGAEGKPAKPILATFSEDIALGSKLK